MHLKYRRDIDGLRAIAVLSVVAFHLNPTWLQGGFIGVDIFFVISGYLITKIIYTDIAKNQFSFKDFYQRRINRILPVFFFVMFMTALGSVCILSPVMLPKIFASIASTPFLLENLFFAKFTGGYWDVSALKMPILHTWSLAVEEQFYIILPFLLLFLFKIKSSQYKVIITLSAIACASFLLAQLSPLSFALSKLNYYSLITGRAGELLIGSIIGILSTKESREKPYDCKINLLIKNSLTLIGSLMVGISIAFLSENKLFPSFWAIIPTAGVALIIYFYDQKTIIARLLSIKPLVFIGTISYSLYLWHWPIIVLAKEYLLIDSLETLNQYLIISGLIIPLTLLSFYLIEKPCRKNKKGFKFSLFFFYIVPSILILTSSLTYMLMERAQHEKLVKRNNFLSDIVMPIRSNGYCFYDFNSNDKLKIDNNLAQHCLMGDKTKKPNVLLFGSSFAGMYDPFLDRLFKNNSLSYNSVTTNWCSPILSDSYAGPKNQPSYKQCLNNREFLKTSIEEKKYKTIIIADVWSVYENKDFRSDLISLLKKAKSNNINVILLPSPHRFKTNPIPYLEENLLKNTKKYDLNSYLIQKSFYNNEIEELVSDIEKEKTGGEIIFIKRSDLYPNDEPYFRSGEYNIPYSLDSYHISKLGSYNLYDKFISSGYYAHSANKLLDLLN
ncbi:acyltransferase family protein [Pantoea anthophila]|uniref:acyltransferase family protein n=1 Tax=Pantoea anthophila TaxID=470931 RepID=UPI002898A1B4|nr:acyltransferase family protein [Pantoea anthophila]